jgi:cysteine-rich repeat protein
MPRASAPVRSAPRDASAGALDRRPAGPYAGFMELRAHAGRARRGAGAGLVFGTSLVACGLTACNLSTYGSDGETRGSTGAAGSTGPATGETTGTSAPDTTGSSSGGTSDGSGEGPTGSSGAAAVCGDGVVDDGEACDDGNDADDDDCLAACVAAACGDGVVRTGVEQCDDGNLEEGDGCSATCTIAVCGDGEVQPPETCDDGNADDGDACPTTCQTAKCGDGHTWFDKEECDAGADSALCDSDCTIPMCGDEYVNPAAGEQCDAAGEPTAECDPDCTVPMCGDSYVSVAAGEECDDGNVDAGDGCSPACTKERRVVFVSSVLYTGNLGGLAGADNKCQQLAGAAGLKGSFKAWLSDQTAGPSQRFVKSTVPYVLPGGQQVAKSWADLTDGLLVHAIDQTEQKGAPPAAAMCSGKPTAWTNTREDGTSWGGNVCGNFSNTSGEGRLGSTMAVNFSWSRHCLGGAGTCAWKAPLYCFEQ